jgi:hypothetical protein
LNQSQQANFASFIFVFLQVEDLVQATLSIQELTALHETLTEEVVQSQVCSFKNVFNTSRLPTEVI